jgi:hypothetical protein
MSNFTIPSVTTDSNNDHTISVDEFARLTERRENLGAAFAFCATDPIACHELVYTDQLCTTIEQLRSTIEKLEDELKRQKNITQRRIDNLFSRPATSNLLRHLKGQKPITIKKPDIRYTPYRKPITISSSSSKSSKPLPSPPIKFRTSPTITEFERRRWRKEYLTQEFSDYVESGSKSNPIEITDDDDDDPTQNNHIRWIWDERTGIYRFQRPTED